MKSGNEDQVKRELYTHADGGSIHNSQKVEATQVSIDRCMDKEDVARAYDGTSLSYKRRKP